jgi:hypothetical protein
MKSNEMELHHCYLVWRAFLNARYGGEYPNILISSRSVSMSPDNGYRFMFVSTTAGIIYNM